MYANLVSSGFHQEVLKHHLHPCFHGVGLLFYSTVFRKCPCLKPSLHLISPHDHRTEVFMEKKKRKNFDLYRFLMTRACAEDAAFRCQGSLGIAKYETQTFACQLTQYSKHAFQETFILRVHVISNINECHRHWRNLKRRVFAFDLTTHVISEGT